MGTQETLRTLAQQIGAIEELHSRIGGAIESANRIKQQMVIALAGTYDPVIVRTLDDIIGQLQNVAGKANQGRQEIAETQARIVQSARG
jgi:hypothetical protein